MKTKITKIGLLGLAILVGIALNSFTIVKSNAKTKAAPLVETTQAVALISNWEEYNKVNEYVRKNICNVIRESDKVANVKEKGSYMSRCPSGYQSNITDHSDSVTVDKIVYGKINYYKGCGRNYICDFKACVSKGIALVKTKDMKEYVPVKEWLSSKETKPATMLKG
jgi:hypothetical protein